MFNLFSKKKNIATNKDKINDDVLAVIYLLVEAGNIDENFEEREKKIITTIIEKQFKIEDKKLIEETIENINTNIKENIDLIAHTRKVKDNWSLEKRKEVIEMLWKVCLSDNNIDPYEDMLIRKIAGLLYVEAKDSNEAKRKALKSLEK
ncbi:TerB family tellurite resistance protein [Alphaproteobacteria bacterium]|nr:TerB family tellurite resistance protein [Alphaproteobacteria bacterium]